MIKLSVTLLRRLLLAGLKSFQGSQTERQQLQHLEWELSLEEQGELEGCSDVEAGTGGEGRN